MLKALSISKCYCRLNGVGRWAFNPVNADSSSVGSTRTFFVTNILCRGLLTARKLGFHPSNQGSIPCRDTTIIGFCFETKSFFHARGSQNCDLFEFRYVAQWLERSREREKSVVRIHSWQLMPLQYNGYYICLVCRKSQFDFGKGLKTLIILMKQYV